jgi:hypothetical protein
VTVPRAPTFLSPATSRERRSLAPTHCREEALSTPHPYSDAVTPLQSVLALAILVISAFGLSLPSRSLRNPATPMIRSGYTAKETVQILDAIEDAFLLASTVVTAPGDLIAPIFVKYFSAANGPAVFGKYHAEDNDDVDDSARFLPLETDSGTWTLESDVALLGRTCGDLDLRVSRKMRTLGSILLHDFTHAGLLVMPPLAYDVEGLQDHVYGAHSCQGLDKKLALYNADSYAWLAMEIFWSIACKRSFQNPIDDFDVIE